MDVLALQWLDVQVKATVSALTQTERGADGYVKLDADLFHQLLEIIRAVGRLREAPRAEYQMTPSDDGCELRVVASPLGNYVVSGRDIIEVLLKGQDEWDRRVNERLR